MHRVALALAFSIGLIGLAPGGSAAPSVAQTEITDPASSIVDVAHNCPHGSRWEAGHRHNGKWINGRCVRGR
jgi:hypothetical protein